MFCFIHPGSEDNVNDIPPANQEDLLQELERLRNRVSELENTLGSQERLKDDLAEQKLLSRALLNAATDTVVVLDSAGKVLAINETGALRLRRPSDQILGQPIYNFLPEELVASRKAWVEQAVDTRKPIQFKDEYKGVTYGHRLVPCFDPRLNTVRIGAFTRNISDGERAIKALRESEARYKAILEDQTELICRYLPDGRLSYVNEAYARYFGKDRRELINKNFIPHIPEDDISRINYHIAQLSQDNPVTAFEHKIIMETGEFRWQHWTHRAVFDSSGKLVEYQAVGRDITRRRMAQGALGESEARYRSLFEDSPICLWEEDFSRVKGYVDFLRNNGVEDLRAYLDSHPEEVRKCSELVGILDVNKATLEVFEAEDKFALLQSFPAMLTEQSIDLFKQEIIDLTSGLGIFECETVRRTMDGNEKHFSLHLNVAPGYEESLSKVLVSLVDVTDRKRAERELQENQDFLRQIIDTVPSPIFVKDREGRFVMVNKAMAEVYGSNPEAMLGKTGQDFNPHEDETYLFRAEDLEVLDSQQPIFIPQRVLTDAHGRKRWHATTKLPLSGKDQILGVAVDITERKEAEMERARLEKHIRQAQKIQALGTLAGGIAHDFNNMIFAILGFIRLALKQAEPGSKVEEYLKQVQSAGMRASDLVRQILTFSRQTEQEKKPVKMSLLFKEIGKLLRATLPTTIDIRISVPDALSENGDTVLGDPIQFHQVLMNLCTNAAHAMQDTGGILQMSLSDVTVTSEETRKDPSLTSGNYLEIRISDTGHGIDNAIIEQIFDPFFTTKKPGEGTGMGLSVVHGIVRSHGGTIKVDSVVGVGTTFTVLLPKLEDLSLMEEGACQPSPRGSERILFVDDEELLVHMAGDMLSQLGYTVTAVTSPEEALVRFQETDAQYDLVITDQTMPHITGTELAQRILSIKPETPIILLTGYSESVSSDTAKQLGIAEFIMKPVVEEQLAQAIRQVLERRTYREGLCTK